MPAANHRRAHTGSAVRFRLILIAATPQQADLAFVMCGMMPDVGCAVMLRHPEHNPQAVLELCSQVTTRGHFPRNLTLISNAVQAPEIPALHLTSAQLNTLTELPERGAGALVGFSTHTLNEVKHAVELGADYITFGPVFPTPSKPGHPGTGTEALEEVCAIAPMPVFALGGINSHNFRQCIQAGAWGVAGISFAGLPYRRAVVACARDLFGACL